MDMVFIMIRLFEIETRVVLSDFQQFPIEVFPEGIVNYFMSVFGRKD